MSKTIRSSLFGKAERGRRSSTSYLGIKKGNRNRHQIAVGRGINRKAMKDLDYAISLLYKG